MKYILRKLFLIIYKCQIDTCFKSCKDKYVIRCENRFFKRDKKYITRVLEKQYSTREFYIIACMHDYIRWKSGKEIY